MSNFNRKEVVDLVKELNLMLKEFGEKHNVEVNIGRVRFDETISTKLTLTKGQSLKDVLNRKKADQFIENFHLHKIPGKFLDKPFNYNNSEYKLTGYNSRAKKYPIEYEKDGVPFKCTVESIQKILKEVRPQLFV